MPVSYITTEAGDRLLTEAGDLLITEGSASEFVLTAEPGIFTLTGQAATLFVTPVAPPAPDVPLAPPPATAEYFLRYAAPAAPNTWSYIAATTARTTLPTDTPANTVVPGGLSLPNYSISLFDGIEPEFNANSGAGEIVINDPTEQL